MFEAFRLRDAITPIVSFSHGMQNKKRINEGIKYGIIYTAIIMIAGANIAFQGVFQALDSGLESLIISVCRQFLFVIPVAYLFAELVISGLCGTWLVWMSFVIAEVLSVLVAVLFMKKVNKNMIMTMS